MVVMMRMIDDEDDEDEDNHRHHPRHQYIITINLHCIYIMFT